MVRCTEFEFEQLRVPEGVETPGAGRGFFLLVVLSAKLLVACGYHSPVFDRLLRLNQDCTPALNLTSLNGVLQASQLVCLQLNQLASPNFICY